MKKLFIVASVAIIAMSSFALAGTTALAQVDDDPFGTYEYTYSSSDDEEAAKALMGVGMIFWVVFCCVWLLISGGLAFWVYSDSKKNSVENGVLWAVLTFLFGLIPLLIYFLAIKKNSSGSSSAKE
ncbi:hypothetical protein JW796_00795 [Candidatus Dojkabacteria bacterium]|nr:hypothetical protein [Candidatus Dojkabacteria bacterium]